jgi:hypothetical protein
MCWFGGLDDGLMQAVCFAAGAGDSDVGESCRDQQALDFRLIERETADVLFLAGSCAGVPSSAVCH